MSRRHDTKSAQAACDRWNAAHPVGTPVEVASRVGGPFERTTTTRSPASVIANRMPVIWLDGIAGCYALECVRPTPAPTPTAEEPQP